MMAGRVNIVLVVLLVLLSLGLALASAKDYVNPDVVVLGREDKVVFNKTETPPRNATSASLYVRPGGGDLIVCVTVDNGTVQGDACFRNLKRHIRSTTWELMTVAAEVVGLYPRRYKLQFNLTLDGRNQTDYTIYKSDNIARLTVSAIGASEWLHQAPPDTCSDDESISVLVKVMVPVVVVVLVLVVVLTIIWKRQKTPLGGRNFQRFILTVCRRDAPKTYCEMDVKNGLQEPLPCSETPAGPQEQAGKGQVIVNGL